MSIRILTAPYRAKLLSDHYLGTPGLFQAFELVTIISSELNILLAFDKRDLLRL